MDVLRASNPLSGEPHGACSCSQPCKLVNEHSAKCHRGAARAWRCVPFHQFRFQQEEHAHIGLRLLNSAHLITRTTCDEGPPILTGNENWYLLYVALQGAASPPTCISFSDCHSSAPQPFCLATWTSCQDSVDCFCLLCLSFHPLVFAMLTFTSLLLLSLFLHPHTILSPSL